MINVGIDQCIEWNLFEMREQKGPEEMAAWSLTLTKLKAN